MTEMKIKALAPWFGGKRTLAPRIVAELGKHTAYWEPFLGGCAILPAKPRSRMETVNDLHGDLINLARVIQSDDLAPRFFERLLKTLPHEDELASSRAITVEAAEPGDAPDLDRAHAFFTVCWLGRNGESGLAKCERGTRLCVRWSDNGGDPATRFRNAVASVPAWWERLRQVTILRRDAFEVIEKIVDAPGAAIYCDPPYLVKSDQYLHDFEGAAPLMGREHDDHERLARSLARFTKARIVVSYYEHPRLRELYPLDRWTHIAAPMAKNLSNNNGAPAKAPEVLIVNGPSFAQEAA